MIHEKMADFGTRHMGAFIRKLVIDGYVIKLEIPELKEILHQLGPIGNNVNQMARKLNAGGSIYREDIVEARGGQLTVDTIERICQGLNITMAEFFTERGT